MTDFFWSWLRIGIGRTIQAIIHRPGTDTTRTCHFHATAVLAHGYATPVTEGKKIAGITQFTFLHYFWEYSFFLVFLKI
jgi:hypothetical protein